AARASRAGFRSRLVPGRGSARAALIGAVPGGRRKSSRARLRRGCPRAARAAPYARLRVGRAGARAALATKRALRLVRDRAQRWLGRACDRTVRTARADTAAR